MSDTRQEGVLAGTHEGEPGLPRGRSGLPAEAVRAAQRERLLRAVIAAVAEAGFRGVTVAGLLLRAPGPRAPFFPPPRGQEATFLAPPPLVRPLLLASLASPPP